MSVVSEDVSEVASQQTEQSIGDSSSGDDQGILSKTLSVPRSLSSGTTLSVECLGVSFVDDLLLINKNIMYVSITTGNFLLAVGSDDNSTVYTGTVLPEALTNAVSSGSLFPQLFEQSTFGSAGIPSEASLLNIICEGYPIQAVLHNNVTLGGYSIQAALHQPLGVTSKRNSQALVPPPGVSGSSNAVGGETPLAPENHAAPSGIQGIQDNENDKNTPIVAVNEDSSSGLPSVYFAAEKVKKHLEKQDGVLDISLPELRQFKMLREFNPNNSKGCCKEVRIRGKSMWDILNPDNGGFKVGDWVEPARQGELSELEKAEKQHESYKQTFYTLLSQPDGVYYPPGNTKYYFRHNANGGYDLMLKPGRRLTQDELAKATRELIVISRDMTDKIDVAVRIHDECKSYKVQELAATITALGATVSEKNTNGGGFDVHNSVVDDATSMRKTAIAPEFVKEDEDKESNKAQESIWDSVFDSKEGAQAQAAELQERVTTQYRLMSAAGELKPEQSQIASPEKTYEKTYWSTVFELEQNIPVSAVTALVGALQSVEQYKKAKKPIPDEAAAHFVPIAEGKRTQYETKVKEVDQKWQAVVKELRANAPQAQRESLPLNNSNQYSSSPNQIPGGFFSSQPSPLSLTGNGATPPPLPQVGRGAS